MASKTHFSCFIIGGDALLMECGDILLARGHELKGVITASPRIVEWANLRALPVVDAAGDYAASLRRETFDYLFAVTHLAVIADDVLGLPLRGAINFHDGPLPRYAGINAPAWALRSRETHYGITWHLMTSGVDRGDILKQVMFEISSDENSLSLNTKCFAHAIESFGELVGELSSGSEVRTPQSTEGRTYFAKHRRPEAACVLDWSRSAADLEATVRAADFGDRHANRWGVAKMLASGKAFVVKNAEARPLRPSAPPGTVVAVLSDAIEVATSDGALAITAAVRLGDGGPGGTSGEGRGLTMAELAAQGELVTGATLSPLSTVVAARLSELDRELARAEDFWVERLTQIEPLGVADGAPPAVGAAVAHAEVALELPDLFRGDLDRVESLVAAFALYGARTAQRDSFSLGVTSRSLLAKTADLGLFVADVVPMVLQIDWALGFHAVRARVADELGALAAHATYTRDVVVRYPELRVRPGVGDGSAWPMSIAVDAPPPRASRLTLVVSTERRDAHLAYDPAVLTAHQAQRVAMQLVTLVTAAVRDPQEPVAKLPLLSEDERARVLVEWNRTARPYPEACIHHQIEEQAARTPDAVALVAGDDEVSYRLLNERANQLAGYLRTLSVGPDVLVGIHLERSIDLVVAALAVLKAGGGYVPLDPDYPSERVAFMLEDSKLKVILSDEKHAAHLKAGLGGVGGGARVVRLDSDWGNVSSYPRQNLEGGADPSHLAYVIYTSGSTGAPKGVMVEHRNVVSFFAGMDERIPHDPPGTWLAVTSLSFDISVLELFFTLSRGFRVVIHRDRERATSKRMRANTQTHLEFSLFYFASDEAEASGGKYDLLLKGAKFADQNGFSAVWTPERHFHAFGGLYPNPAITGAALAVATQRLQIRAGSVVLPLHHPIRVAEGWAVVDNLSNGRVGVSFASGWQPNDFVLRPEAFADAKAIMFRDIEVVKALWRGEAVSFMGPRGAVVEVRTLPRPVQSNLPIWITTAGNVETYRMAGQIGANVLTHLLGQSTEQLAPKIQAYRAARSEHGHDPDAGIVSLMLHTFVGKDPARVRETVREPLKRYLASSLELLKQYAWAFPAFSRPQGTSTDDGDELAHLSDDERDAMLEHAFSRYYETSGLFGRPEDCVARVAQLQQIGVNDVACLIDFGIPNALVLEHLHDLADLVTLATRRDAGAHQAGESIGAEIERHGVTHLQCTPSMARMLLDDRETRSSLSRLKCVMLGGEALPVDLVRSLRGATSAALLNMYGPTETTVWSTTAEVGEGPISIGRPIANTRVYLLDARKEPVPVGSQGELFIAGEGVARGYLYRDELTAQRFLSDPFHHGKRMYRTGDMARFSDDGSLEFCGRRDEQVKVRGHRVELREIEAALARSSEVQECVVIMREDAPGDQRLVAYVVPRNGKVDAPLLRESLRARLPEFMIPSHVVSLARLPHTPNRKVDRKALPRPADVEGAPMAAFAPPESPIEQVIAKLWREVLGRDRIGTDDNFFDVGGHSLLVVKMHRKLCELIPEPVSLTDLYRFPTIRSLSKFLSAEAPPGAAREGDDRASVRREMMQKRRARVVEE